ncbi:MAG TPA: aminoglycoside phosphotransferase family protein [Parapedobacter sp.]|uniref:aminoglycoside phosphotransferase family protein n=1 Tax=Parapedobacter sp. TaxID=1958893 RepID=UPI002BE1E197|nr:aminoglycoside phosphotransferase family protein [Parapedobacter sp.]HWK57479.1 aminoglycoside phosphotransferase family protein [Parapedobacter sp.]
MASRKAVYYWKSDRPYTLGNTHNTSADEHRIIEKQLEEYLTTNYRKDLKSLSVAGGQGNHVTYLAVYPDARYFVRLENGPEKDDYMIIESAILTQVKALGVPSPDVYLTDTSRSKVPFAIQVMECIAEQDLNVLEKAGLLDTVGIASDIGRNIAIWQSITPEKYGLFNSIALEQSGKLEGYHDTYAQYFFLNWDVHLDFLCTSEFIDAQLRRELQEVVSLSSRLLNLADGCLVHKDLALWNILGNNECGIKAFIDWDDAVSGDPTDDLSLLGCFHSGEVVLAAVSGYQQVRPLPVDFERRFWLHLLRNIIFKSVIRVKGNYFDKSDKFFLNNPGHKSLKRFTIDRIHAACDGLKGNKSISSL